ncbi:MAG: glycosyltransferase family 39 protein, partial [Pseudomonadota bacterium]
MSAITTDHPDIAVEKEQASDVGLINVLRVLLIVALLPFIAMKLAYVFAMPVLPDEGYYWMWGQNLALSYYDHPPLLAWLQGLSHAVFGSTIFSLRLVPMLAFSGMVWIAWDWCKRLAPEGRAVDALLITLIVWLASPLLLRYTTLGIQDCLLIAFTMASIHFAALFMVRRDEIDREDWRLFFAACVFVGLAGLSKYNAVFIAAGFALYLLCTASGRSLLSRWQIWAGLAVIAAMQAPTLVWNIQNGWP